MERGLQARLANADSPWEAHFQTREREWVFRDSTGAIVAVIALAVATARIPAPLGLAEAAWHAALVCLALALYVHSKQAGRSYTPWRNVAVVALRLGLCASSVLCKHALYMMQGSPAQGAGVPGVVRGVLRMLIADHTALLAFLGFAWPVGALTNLGIQAAGLVLVARQNPAICATPYMHQATAPAISRTMTILHVPLLKRLAAPSAEQVCRWYTLGIQATLGFLVPVLVWGCSDVQAACRYAEEQGVDHEDRLLRLYCWLSRAFCTGKAGLYWVAAAAAVIAAAAAAALLLIGN